MHLPRAVFPRPMNVVDVSLLDPLGYEVWLSDEFKTFPPFVIFQGVPRLFCFTLSLDTRVGRYCSSSNPHDSEVISLPYLFVCLFLLFV